jgi:hypothetical protein
MLLRCKYAPMVSSLPAVSAFFESILESADAAEPMMNALSTSPRNMHTHVKYFSASVAGSMSYGTIAVTMAAPQKNAAANCGLSVSEESKSALGCQLFCGSNGVAVAPSSKSATNHHAQPSQWHMSIMSATSLATRMKAGLNLMTSSRYLRFFESLARRSSRLSLTMRSRRSWRLSREVALASPSSEAASKMKLSGKLPIRSMKKAPRK